jgi:ABC-type Fe3+-hydroxamate transport system substrate-binding protein
MNRVLAIVAIGLSGVLFGVVACFVSLVVWQSYDESRALDVTAEVCGVEDADGRQVCVQRREGRAGVLGGDQIDYLYFVHRVDGEDIPRVTYAPYPFHDSDLNVTVEAERVVVRGKQHGGPDAVVTYPQGFYSLDNS